MSYRRFGALAVTLLGTMMLTGCGSLAGINTRQAQTSLKASEIASARVAPVKEVKEGLACIRDSGAWNHVRAGVLKWKDNTQKFSTVNGTGGFLSLPTPMVKQALMLAGVQTYDYDADQVGGEQKLREMIITGESNKLLLSNSTEVPHVWVVPSWDALDFDGGADIDGMKDGIGLYLQSGGAVVVGSIGLNRTGSRKVLGQSITKRQMYSVRGGLLLARSFDGFGLVTGRAGFTSQSRLQLETLEYMVGAMVLDVLAQGDRVPTQCKAIAARVLGDESGVPMKNQPPAKPLPTKPVPKPGPANNTPMVQVQSPKKAA